MSTQTHSGEQHHGLAHVMPVKLLLAVWGVLMVGTVITVAAIKIDLGARANLLIAMTIATIKAAFVILYFMHLKWDKRFNLFVFLGSLAFVSIFVSFLMIDSGQYQHDIKSRVEVLEQQK